MKKKYVVFLMILLILILLFTNVSRAEFVEVTENVLKETFANHENIEVNDDTSKFYKLIEDSNLSLNLDTNYKFSLSDGKIEINNSNMVYSINYDLSGDPKFTVTVPIKKGMTYEEYAKGMKNIRLLMYGFTNVASIQGIEIKDAIKYITNIVSTEDIRKSVASPNQYYITDSSLEGSSNDGKNGISSGLITIEENGVSKTIELKNIEISEFGNYAIEYVNSVYPNEIETIDDKDKFNSFTWITQKQNITDTSYDLVSTLTIKKDADYLTMKENIDKVSDGTSYSVTKTTRTIQQNSSENSSKDSSSSSSSSGAEINGASGTASESNNASGTESESNVAENNSSNNSVSNKANGQTTTGSSKLPKTGKTSNPILNGVYIIVGICTISLIIILINRKRFMDR